MKKTGLVHIYYGKGKGKTTLSLGLALRFWGWGKKVAVFQFLKPKKFPSGEIEAIDKLDDNFKIERFDHSHPIFKKKVKEEKLKREIANSLDKIEALMKKEKFDLIVLDEILNAIDSGFIPTKKVIELIKNKPKNTELVITGRPLVEKLKKYADYISEIREIKHPFQKGVRARKGAEF